jgi:DNA repair photolyase
MSGNEVAAEHQAQLNALRWQGQRIDAIAPGALPGLARVSNLVQSVRTPEFEGVTFHEVLTKSALNHVAATSTMLPGEWTINPYRGCTHACAYCYARPTHEHLGLDLGADFDRQIVVKVNIGDVLAQELATKRVLPERVALGTNTDPYQRAEGRYELMPRIIDALTGARIPFSILTKGSVIRRDLDRLARSSASVNVELGLSISFLDEELRHSLEPGTPSTSSRLATLAMIRDAGMDCTVFLAPILPLLSDSEQQLDDVVAALAEAGATNVLPTPLYLMTGVKELYFTWLRRAHPELVGPYSELFAHGSRSPQPYRDTVRDRVHRALRRHGLPIPDDSTSDKFALHGKRGRPTPTEPAEPTLF